MSVQSRDFAAGAAFVTSARDMGVETISAIFELIDNAIDADAENIRVHVENNGEYLRIFVEDDGKGIKPIVTHDGDEYDGITYAFAFGDNYDQEGLQIGRFGWGLPQSATCTSLRTEIYTHQRDEENWRYSYVDLDEMEAEKDTEPPTAKEKKPSHIDLDVADESSGTVVSFEKCDNPEPKTVTGIYKRLISNVPRTYRYFLQGSADIRITAEKDNGEYLEEDLKPNDPLFMMDKAHNVGDLPNKVPKVDSPKLDKTIFIEDSEGEEHPVRIRIVMLDVESIRRCDETGRSWMQEHNLVERNQGFSLVRENREIRGGKNSLDLGLFEPHSDKNYMRAEIKFPPELDNKFGIQVEKNRLNPKESVKSRIDEAIGNTPYQIQTETREIITDLIQEAQDEDEEDAEPSPSEAAAEKADQLIAPIKDESDEEVQETKEEMEREKQKEIEEVKQNEELDEEEKDEKIENKDKKYERRKNRNSWNITSDEFYGTFFKPKFIGNQKNTVLNKKHPFYNDYDKVRKGLYGNTVTTTDGGIENQLSQQTEASILIDHLLLSASFAELRVQNRIDHDEIDQIMRQFRREWSEALRMFLEYIAEGKDEAITNL